MSDPMKMATFSKNRGPYATKPLENKCFCKKNLSKVLVLAKENPQPQKSQRVPRQEKAMVHCDLRMRWKVASDLRFRVAISEPKTHSFCGTSGDLAPCSIDARKSLAITIVRFWCAKILVLRHSMRVPECS